MLTRNRHMQPSFAPPDDGGNAPDAGTEAVESMGVAAPNVSTSRFSAPVPREQRNYGTPTSMESRGVAALDDAENPDPGDKADSGSSFTVPENFLDDDFDLEGVPAALRGPLTSIREKYSEALESIPNKEELSNMYLQARAFEKIAQSDTFKRYLAEVGEVDTSEEPITPDLKNVKDPKIQALLEHFDPEQISVLQNLVESMVQAKVQPLSESYYKDKAIATLDQLQQKYGDNWKANEKDTYKAMTQYGLPAEAAYKMVMGEKLMQSERNRGKEEALRKVRNSDVNGGPRPSVSKPQPVRTNPKTIREAMEMAEEMVARNDENAFDARAYRQLHG